MDYYEELGVAPTASAEEIRQAYRILARILHPDQHPEGPARDMAERQMKRLNLMMEVLTDVQARARYDRSLLQPAAVVPAPLGRPILRRGQPGMWVWAVSALVGVAGIGWYLTQESVRGARVRATPVRAGTTAAAAPAKPAPAPVAAIKPARERPAWEQPARAARRKPARAVQLDSAPPLTEPLRMEAPPPVAADLRLPVPVAPPVVDRPPQPSPRFAGAWLYVKPAHEAMQPGLYPPEYIELKISEKDNLLWGSYHARYLIADQAISPVVAFSFEGRAELPVARFSWTGAGGARGQVTLTLRSSDAMEVNWRAEQLGNELGLTSGVSTLVRRRDH